MNLCLWKKNGSRFDLMSLLCFFFRVLSFKMQNEVMISLLQEREKEFEESLTQNIERVVSRLQLL